MSFLHNQHNNGSPTNYNLAMYLPLTIAVLSALVMFSKSQAILSKIAFIPGHPELLSEPWRFLTYAFFEYTRPFSLLFTTLFLWWVGTPVEQQYGSRSYALFFIICSISAAIASLLINSLSSWGKIAHMLGPEAMLWGGTWVFSRIHPEQEFLFMFFIPVKAKYFPLLLVGARLLFTGIFTGAASIPIITMTIAAEISGAAAGILFLYAITRNRTNKGRKESAKNQKKEETTRIKEIKLGEQEARPIHLIASRLEAGSATANDRQQLQKALDRSFDFTVCPLADFERDDAYCKSCPAYTHCLAKEITAGMSEGASKKNGDKKRG